MAKNSVEVYGAEGKTNVLSFDPNVLVIVEDTQHPLYDERIHLPLDEAMVKNVMTYGVIEPVLVWKDPETAQVLVVAGRQRVRHAREANQRLSAEGRPTLLVPGIAQRGTIDQMADKAILENELRRNDTPMARARKMAAYAARGYTDNRLALIFGCSEATVHTHMILMDCTVAVQKAVDGGQINLTHAKALAKLDPAEQRAKAAELIAAGTGAKPHERARKQAAIVGGDAPRPRTKKEISKALDTADGEVRHALRWVLGLESELGAPVPEAADA